MEGVRSLCALTGLTKLYLTGELVWSELDGERTEKRES